MRFATAGRKGRSRTLALAGILAGALRLAPAAEAQSPHSAALVVVVTDPTGAPLPGASVTATQPATGTVRRAVSGADGASTFAALPPGEPFTVAVSLRGFVARDVSGLALRAGEKATVRVRLELAGRQSEVTVFGTVDGVRADPQIGLRLDGRRIDETPIFGRKVSALPLYNAAFRQGKGTGDVYLNTNYAITGVGSRRTTSTTLDGATNDESWGRQVPIATVPLGAVQEVTSLSNAFSSEYGWTSGPALNMVTKSGTNELHGGLLYSFRPGGLQSKSFSTEGFCPDSTPGCVTPATLQSIVPPDVPDTLNQGSASIGGPLAKDRTFFFLAADYTAQERTVLLSSSLPSYVLPADGSLEYAGAYHQALVDARLDHRLDDRQTLMLRLNYDRFRDTNPQDTVGGTNAPTVARTYTRGSLTAQLNHTAVLSADAVNEARVAYLGGDPVTLWKAQDLSTTYARSGPAPFTIGQSRVADLYSRALQVSDTVSLAKGKHSLRVGFSVVRHTSGGTGSEFGTATLGTFTFKSTSTAPPDQLTLADVQSYSQPIAFGIDRYDLSQWLVTGFVQDSIRLRPDLTVDVGLRYDRQTITDAKTNFVPRIGFGWHPGGDERTSIRGGYGMYYTQVRANVVASYLVSGLDGLASYTAVAGQTGFPTCLTGSCLPVPIDPKALPPSQIPARDITIQAGRRDFYREQFARYGLSFDLLPSYPEELVNPRSQVITVGAERELARGLFLGADYVHQHLSDIDRTVDLNAPSAFERTAPGQVRSVAAANATRPILPVNGGVRQVNVLMNLGEADYDGLQTQLRYNTTKLYASLSYTLSKATNTTEPDGNGIAPNEGSLARLGEVERGPSLVDQRHRAVLSVAWRLPYEASIGAVAQVASARPFSATTGVDNNGDGLNNDRPVVDGQVLGRSTFRGTATSSLDAFLEGPVKLGGGMKLVLRVEGFNLLNHGNYLGRAQTVYGDKDAPNSTFGQLVAVGTSSTALPALANVDPPRMFQLSARLVF